MQLAGQDFQKIFKKHLTTAKKNGILNITIVLCGDGHAKPHKTKCKSPSARQPKGDFCCTPQHIAILTKGEAPKGAGRNRRRALRHFVQIEV